jgi:hypothetical protein
MTFQQYSDNEPQATGGQCIDFVDPNDRFSGCSGNFIRLITSSHYEKSQGSSGTSLNSEIDLLENSVIVGTTSGTPSWQFTNVSETNNRLLTVTAICHGTTGSPIGSTCTINNSPVGINWVNSTHEGDCNTDPTFSGCWDIITFRILKDSSGTFSVFACTEGYYLYVPPPE